MGEVSQEAPHRRRGVTRVATAATTAVGRSAASREVRIGDDVRLARVVPYESICRHVRAQRRERADVSPLSPPDAHSRHVRPSTWIIQGNLQGLLSK